jgi:hypothetical protein
MSDLFDKAKDLLGENRDTVEDVVDKIADVVDGKTGGKHADQIAKGAEKAKDAIASFVGDDDPKAEPAKPQHAEKQAEKKRPPEPDA